jgi:hypothetical protein
VSVNMTLRFPLFLGAICVGKNSAMANGMKFRGKVHDATSGYLSMVTYLAEMAE